MAKEAVSQAFFQFQAAKVTDNQLFRKPIFLINLMDYE
jgi:hypothetical protein